MKLISIPVLRLALLPIMLALAAYVFWLNLQRLHDEIAHAVRSRSELVSKFVAQHRDQVMVMHHLLKEHYRASPAQVSLPLAFQRNEALDAWSLDVPDASGILSGSGRPPQAPALQREMRAALGMEAQIRAARQFDGEVSWLYYLSASDFIYLAPRTPLEQFRFTPQLYQRRYWLEAMPKVNTERRMVLAGPYQDLAGQGWIITFAQPVYEDDQFLGVVALDLRTDTLQKLLNVGAATGETLLVSENDRLMGRQAGLQAEERLQLPSGLSQWTWTENQGSERWWHVPIVPQELWLVHRVSRGELYQAAAVRSLPDWALVALLVILGLVALRLRDALFEVRRMTQVDPLTQVLNRRGFYERQEDLINQTRRQGRQVALLMMDIDFFKKINDTFGHAVGDSVLRQLGAHLLQARRAGDLVCRWGGEEFIVLFALDSIEQAQAAAERLREQAQQARIEPENHPVTLSGGLVILQPEETVDAAIQRADLLLYQAKGNGRNRIKVNLQAPAPGMVTLGQ